MPRAIVGEGRRVSAPAAFARSRVAGSEASAHRPWRRNRATGPRAGGPDRGRRSRRARPLTTGPREPLRGFLRPPERPPARDTVPGHRASARRPGRAAVRLAVNVDAGLLLSGSAMLSSVRVLPEKTPEVEAKILEVIPVGGWRNVVAGQIRAPPSNRRTLSSLRSLPPAWPRASRSRSSLRQK